MSFSTSTMYVAITLGAMLGGLVIHIGSVDHIGWVGGLFVGLSLVLFFLHQDGRLSVRGNHPAKIAHQCQWS